MGKNKGVYNMSQQQAVEFYLTYNLTLIDDYIGVKTAHTCITKEGYKIQQRVESLKNIKNIIVFGQSNKHTVENIKLWLILNNKNFTLKQNEKYVNNRENLCFICPRHGEFYVSWGKVSQGAGCQHCNKKILSNDNRVSLVRPDLVKYFENKKDAENVSVCSDKSVRLVCLNCGTKKSMKMHNLHNRGFCCSLCSDGISIPNKFVMGIIKQLNVCFDSEKTFKWSKKKRYDFYIPSLNMIIEAHGLQHYESDMYGIYKNKHAEIEKNDNLKKQLAIENKITNYVVIDCRFSNFGWLIENCEKSMSEYFDLSNIDWKTIENDCTKTIIKDICYAWNTIPLTERTVTNLINILTFKLNRTTIIKYLKIGTHLNWCEYDPKEELRLAYSRIKLYKNL